MLRLTTSTSSDQAKGYFREGLSRGDYYTEKEAETVWSGKVATRLGLKGPVTAQAFDAVVEGRHPASGKKLTQRMKDNRRPGFDLTFNPPKSVSVMIEVGGDQRLLAAFREAVGETMREIEADMQARVRKSGLNANRVTGEALWSEFYHHTTRPVDGVPDCHTHAHCFLMNVTYDAKEGVYKAIETGELHRDRIYYQEAFHARLAAKARELGYGIVRKGKAWEIAGISEDVLTRFSRRTAEVERTAKRLGITDPEQKAALGAKTRSKKHKEQSMEQLREEWRTRLNEGEQEALMHLRQRPDRLEPRMSAEHALNYATEHSFERASVVQDKRLLATALRHGFGEVTPEQAWQALGRSDVRLRTIDGVRYATIDAVLDEERAMLDFARKGRGACQPLAPEAQIANGGSVTLNPGQMKAVEHVWQSRGRVIAIRGGAGTGKTTLLREAIRGLEEAGHGNIGVFAPSTEASRGVLRSEGFHRADTVQALLASEALQQQVENGIIWVDEAGLLSNRQMAALFGVAERKNARVVLMGDIKQHVSVERGDALRLLEQEAGIRPAEVDGIVRQKGRYREAVAAMAKDDLERAFSHLEAMGAIAEVADSDRYQKIADWYGDSVARGKRTLVVSPTHAEADLATAAIRLRLKERGVIRGTEQVFPILRDTGWTEAERGDTGSYRPGMVIEFQRATRGIKRGTRFHVEGVRNGQVLVSDKEGKPFAVPLKHAAKFSVAEPGKIEIAVGDRIRVTANGKTLGGKRLHNGTLLTVRGFTPNGDLVVEDGKVVARDFGRVAYGFVATSHASQGKTVDRVLVAQSSASFQAASREQFYVSISRAKESLQIMTDDKEGLKQAIKKSSQRLSATELMRRAHERGEERGLAWGERLKLHATHLQQQVAMRVRNTLDRLPGFVGRYMREGGVSLER